RSVPGQKLHPVGTARAEDVDRPAEGIMSQRLLDKGSETVSSFAEVDRPRRHQYLQSCRNRDHSAAFTARSTSLSQTGSTPGSARTTAPAISMTTVGERSPVVLIASRSAATTGTNIGPSS